MLQSSTNKTPCLIKDLENDENEEKIFSTKFVPQNYSIPMDCKGDKIIYIYREMDIFKKQDKKSKQKNLEILIYDFQTEKQSKVDIVEKSIKLIKFFREGFVYVQKNKEVHYYDITTKKNMFLFNMSQTIVTLTCDKNFIAAIDKSHKINIFNFQSQNFLLNDIKLKELQDVPSELLKRRLFEMEYPYFSVVNGDYYAFTSDFGMIIINIKKQLGD